MQQWFQPKVTHLPKIKLFNDITESIVSDDEDDSKDPELKPMTIGEMGLTKNINLDIKSSKDEN